MQKKTMLFLLAVLFLAACPMFGQTTGGSGMAPGEVKFFGSMLGLGIAGGLCGIGQGKAIAGAAEAMARNPDHLRACHDAKRLVAREMERLRVGTAPAVPIFI